MPLPPRREHGLLRCLIQHVSEGVVAGVPLPLEAAAHRVVPILVTGGPAGHAGALDWVLHHSQPVLDGGLELLGPQVQPQRL